MGKRPFCHTSVGRPDDHFMTWEATLASIKVRQVPETLGSAGKIDHWLEVNRALGPSWQARVPKQTTAPALAGLASPPAAKAACGGSPGRCSIEVSKWTRGQICLSIISRPCPPWYHRLGNCHGLLGVAYGVWNNGRIPIHLC